MKNIWLASLVFLVTSFSHAELTAVDRIKQNLSLVLMNEYAFATGYAGYLAWKAAWEIGVKGPELSPCMLDENWEYFAKLEIARTAERLAGTKASDKVMRAARLATGPRYRVLFDDGTGYRVGFTPLETIKLAAPALGVRAGDPPLAFGIPAAHMSWKHALTGRKLAQMTDLVKTKISPEDLEFTPNWPEVQRFFNEAYWTLVGEKNVNQEAIPEAVEFLREAKDFDWLSLSSLPMIDPDRFPIISQILNLLNSPLNHLSDRTNSRL